MLFTDAELDAMEISENTDEISVEHEGDGYWSVYVLQCDGAAFWSVVPGEVLTELAENYEDYTVTVYHRDGSLWS